MEAPGRSGSIRLKLTYRDGLNGNAAVKVMKK